MKVARFPEGDVVPYSFSVSRQGSIWGQGWKTISLDNAQVYVTWGYLFLYHYLLKVNSTRQTVQYNVTLRCVRATIIAVEKL